ncbi:MAG: hypothetical protein NTV05_12945 [Acidobacteria bacterium]|nr:hypothetical protein [Acidobacteriota bacterium]
MPQERLQPTPPDVAAVEIAVEQERRRAEGRDGLVEALCPVRAIRGDRLSGA